MVDITKIDTSIQVLDIPHSWRPLRVIASMTTQHWNASASSGPDRTAKAREGCLGSRYKNGTSSQGFSTFQSLPYRALRCDRRYLWRAFAKNQYASRLTANLPAR